MHLKDAMREGCIQELADMWFWLVSSYKDSQPEAAAMVLEAVKRYISWIDIGLVANERFIPLLFALPNSPNESLQGAAAGCIREILAKRMDWQLKLQLVQQLGIVGVCKGWLNGKPAAQAGQELSTELAEKYAALLTTLATELLECWKRAENGVISINAMGLAVDPEAMAEVKDATVAALGLLSELFPAVISGLRCDADEVAMTIMPFLHAYMQRIRRMPEVPEQHMVHVRMALDGLLACSMYPADMQSDEEADPEAEEAVADKRRELFTLFKGIAKISFHEAAKFVGTHLEATLVKPGATFQEVEVVVTLLYQLGEGAPEEMSKPGLGLLGQMAALLMQSASGLKHARQRLVAVAVLETYVRYGRVAAQEARLMPLVLHTFLDDRGMGHPAPAVSTRACYLFQRLVRTLRSSVSLYLDTVLRGCEPHLVRIASTPLATADVPSGLKGTHGKGPTGASSYLDDRMYAFEAVGLLLGGDDLPAERQLAFVQGLLGPLVSQVESHTPAAARGSLADAQLVQHALIAIAYLSKGFTTHMVTVARPGLGKLLSEVLEAVLRVPVAAPRHKAIRARVTGVLHRYVEVLDGALVPYVPAALEALLYEGIDAVDAGDVLGLLVQLVCRHKAAMGPICERAVGPVLDICHVLLPLSWDWSGRIQAAADGAAAHADATGSTEEMREQADLQRSYYALLAALTSQGLTACLAQLPSATFDRCMQALICGVASHVDPAVRKTCVQVLQALVAAWLPGSQEAFPGVRRWVLEKVAGEALLRGVLQSALDLRDAGVMSLLGEVASALRTVYTACGDDFLGAVAATGWPQPMVDHLAYAVKSAKEPRELRHELKSLMLQLQQAQGLARR